MLLKVTTSDHRLNSLLQFILYPFTGGAPSKNTLLMYMIDIDHGHTIWTHILDVHYVHKLGTYIMDILYG